MAGPASSYKAVVAALAANAFVTLIKVVAFGFSGSGAMLSEAIHSAADAGNQFLLFLGLKRGAKERDEEFHYGYGGERFVFGILSASGIFFIGCGVTVYHGVHALLHPEMPELNAITFVVLGLSMLLEGGSTWYAFHTVMKNRGGEPFFKYLREKVDPAAMAILLEDSAAILGLVFATIGIITAYFTQNPLWDALGSILVGLLLGVVAVHLILENRDLLLGKAVPAGVQEKFVRIVKSRKSIRDIHDIKTRKLTPESYKLKAEIAFEPSFVAEKLAQHLPRGIQDAEREKTLRALAISALNAVSDEIDAIEDAIRREIPEATHIDLEVDHTHEERSALATPATSDQAISS